MAVEINYTKKPELPPEVELAIESRLRRIAASQRRATREQLLSELVETWRSWLIERESVKQALADLGLVLNVGESTWAKERP
jgi:phytoene/squalene synthetase